jgi:single-strand DNA-binding protein
MNRVTLKGRLTADPQLRHTAQGTPFAFLRLAINRRSTDGRQLTDYVDVTAWSTQAETSAAALTKGELVLVEGRLSSDTRQVDGKSDTRLRVSAQRVHFLGAGHKPASQELATSAEATA